VNNKRGGLFLVSSTTAARFEGFYTLSASERGRLKEKRKRIVSTFILFIQKLSSALFVQKKRFFRAMISPPPFPERRAETTRASARRGRSRFKCMFDEYSSVKSPKNICNIIVAFCRRRPFSLL
jgi:hypothetical protein|tara:strand:- start:1409 stop:1780 length:372 start_codon:yes stop_codon:yes gene_type:complete